MQEVEYLIIGAGPAGLQLGYFLKKSGHDYLILEAGESPGTFFKRFPRHRLLISINKVNTGYTDKETNLRWDWNSLLCDNDDLLFKNYSTDYFPGADDLVRYMNDFAAHYQLNIKCNTRATSVSKDDRFHVMDDSGNKYSAKYLVVVTGLSKQFKPDIMGIEHAEDYWDVSVDPNDFTGQRVLLIGKGNSSFETANNLLSNAALVHLVSPSPIKMAWKTHYVGNVRSVNNMFFDSYLLKSQNALLDANVKKIEYKDGKYTVTFLYTHACGEEEVTVYDRVINCAGFATDMSLFDDSCKPMLAINDRFPKQTSAWESVNVPGLYFAGAITHQRDFKKKQSGFIHGFRYNVEFLHRLFEHKHHGKEWAHMCLPRCPEAVTNKIIERVNQASSIWQQTNFFCDLIVVPKEGGEVYYYTDLPIDYVQDTEFGQHAQYYTVSMDFGQAIIDSHPDPFNVPRVHKDDFENAHLSTGIHPWIRRYSHGRLLYTHHVIEDLFSEWKEDIHIEPLKRYMSHELDVSFV